jgi:hypothetical protein
MFEKRSISLTPDRRRYTLKEPIPPELTEPFTSGQSTALKAAEILVQKNLGFRILTAKQKRNLLVAFARRGMVVYGNAFDIIKLSAEVNMDDAMSVEEHLDCVTVFEIKSTRKKIPPDFKSYFFALTAGEVLVAQSLKKRFRFVFVNVSTGDHLELSLREIFSRAKGIYPTWSISF